MSGAKKTFSYHEVCTKGTEETLRGPQFFTEEILRDSEGCPQGTEEAL